MEIPRLNRLLLGIFSCNAFFFQFDGISQDQRANIYGIRAESGLLWNNSTSAVHMNELTNKFRNYDGTSIDISDIKGSMYYNQDFVEGSIYLGDSLYGKLFMRYNAYADEMEVKKSIKNEPTFVFKSNTLKFHLNDKQYIIRDYLDSEGKTVRGYLQQLVQNSKYNLFYKENKIFESGKKAETSFHRTLPHRFIDSDSFYISLGDGIPKYLKASKKSLTNLFTKEKPEKLRQYIKKNRIDLKNKEDLIRLVGYFNNKT